MNKFNLSKEQLLERKQLAELCGGMNGSFICTCWNEDGTKTILEEDVDSPEECAMKCLSHRKTSHQVHML